MASAFGGDATRHGTLSGAEVSMKLYLLLFLQYSDSRLRSQHSPMGIPN